MQKPNRFEFRCMGFYSSISFHSSFSLLCNTLAGRNEGRGSEGGGDESRRKERGKCRGGDQERRKRRG